MPINNIINIAAESVAAAICLILLICVIGVENRKDRLNSLFILMLACNLIVLVSDIISWSLERTNYSYTLPALLISNFCIYFFCYLWMVVMNYYIFAYVSIKTPQARKMKQTGNIIIFVLAFAALILSQFNHMYYYINDMNVFVRGDYYWLAFFWSIFIFITDTILIIKYRKNIGFGDSLALLSYIVLPSIALVVQLLFYGIMLIYIYMTFAMLVIYIRIHIQQSKVLKQQEIELTNARVDVMLSQIQPHFLYNTLNTIKALIDIDPNKAQDMLTDFSTYLRQNMDSLKQINPVSFSKELEHVKLYLGIEKERFMERLEVVYDLEVDDFCLPVLTVQPLVENAVRHGLMKRKEGGTLKISTRRQKDAILIIVEDNGVGFDVSAQLKDGRSHIGLDNVKQRLATQSNGILIVESIPETGTKAIIKLFQQEGSE